VEPQLIFDVLRWLALPYWRLLRLSGRRPFVLPSAWWALALFLLLAAAFAAVLAGAPVLVYVVLGLLAAPAISALAGWLYLKLPADRPVVFLTRFAAKTGPARDAATDHLDALAGRLRAEPLLREHFELRPLPQALTFDQAQLLLAETAAAAVLFGEVRASGGAARWQLEMLMEWPTGDGSVTNIRTVGPKELSAESFTRREAPAPRHEQFVDASQPLRRLAAETYDADHADRAVGTLLVFASDLIGSDDEPAQRKCLEAAAVLRPQLSKRTCAALEVKAAFASDPADLDGLAGMIARLEEAGEKDADHPDLWSCLVGFAFLLKGEGELDSDRYLAYAQRAVRSDPTHAQSRYNLAEAYMSNGQVEEALVEFDSLVDDPEYSQRPYLHMGIGVVHYNHTHDYEKARDAYRRAAQLRPSPQAFLYLADAHRVLEEYGPARAYYRKALLLDPTLVDAHRGYWALGESNSVAPPGFNRVVSYMAEARTSPIQLNRRLRPILWRLLLWHYHRHPEDSRLHYMLGYCALLRGDFDFAIERLTYEYELVGPADLESLAAAAVAKVLAGDLTGARSDLITFHEAPLRPGIEKLVGASDNLGQRLVTVISPFIWEPRLNALQNARDLEQLLDEVFADIKDVSAWMP
jgi:tetratricopeptide (TPR) repeat protein